MKKLITLLFILFLFIASSVQAQHLKKDGTPDKRYKENKTYSTSTPQTTPTYQSSKTIKVKEYEQNTTRTGAICKDGTSSSATGRGACSRHGGVDRWTY